MPCDFWLLLVEVLGAGSEPNVSASIDFKIRQETPQARYFTQLPIAPINLEVQNGHPASECVRQHLSLSAMVLHAFCYCLPFESPYIFSSTPTLTLLGTLIENSEIGYAEIADNLSSVLMNM